MKNKIWMVCLLIIIAAISAGMLSVINIKTTPIVKKNNEIKLKKGILDIFAIPYEKDRVERIFDERVVIVESRQGAYYKMKPSDGAKNNGSSSIAFEIGGQGFWGHINALIAIRSDYETIDGIKFLKHEETPGLGGRIDEEWFYSQFKGKKLKPKLVMVPYKMAKTENEFDAITGATETSRSVEALINKGVNLFIENLNR